MEELGSELSSSKLRVADLQEEATRNKSESTWAQDKFVSNCKTCKKEFNMTRRRVRIFFNGLQILFLKHILLFQHHCRHCGDIFCNACSDNQMALPGSSKLVRVCDECLLKLVGNYSVIK